MPTQGRVQESTTQTEREFRLVLPSEVAESVRRGLNAEAAIQRPEALVVRIYLDLPGLPLGQRALSTPRNCLKVSATHDAAGHWRVETKEEHGSLTRRTWITVKPEHLRFAFGNAGREMLPAMPEGLSPAFACAFERTAYEHPDGWKVAIDRNLRIHLAGDQAWGGGPLLGPCLARQRSTVFSIQHGPRGVPAWLQHLEKERAVPFSRFAIGVRQLLLAHDAKAAAAL